MNALKPNNQEEQERPLFSAVKDAEAQFCGDKSRLQIAWKDGDEVCKLDDKEWIVLNKELLADSWELELEDLTVSAKVDAFLAGTY